jgi:hypothetical protein
MEHLRFPIGRFIAPDEYTQAIIENAISDLELFPIRLNTVLTVLSKSKLDIPYRPDGWTVRQAVHHCADSHMNSIIRFKLALTEDKPIIKPYLEDKWVEMADEKTYPIESSLKIIEGVHDRLTRLLRSLSVAEMNRSFIHPEFGKEVSIQENICFYAWHSNHHLAHIGLVK